jgi:hypothetical protein
VPDEELNLGGACDFQISLQDLETSVPSKKGIVTRHTGILAVGRPPPHQPSYSIEN